MKANSVSGGCQCGSVRYRIRGPLANPHICHCRMCQKAAGNVFMPLVNAKKTDIEWTRGKPAHFASSNAVRRGFCADCGTPLTFETLAADHLNVTIGSLDDPAGVTPMTQDGVESRIAWFKELHRLPEIFTDAPAAANHQHPDHDTDRWPRR
jgi:hypothetical protein